MLKFCKIIATLILIGGTLTATPAVASAYPCNPAVFQWLQPGCDPNPPQPPPGSVIPAHELPQAYCDRVGPGGTWVCGPEVPPCGYSGTC